MADQNLMNAVVRMRSEGLSNDQIAQRLLYQGYNNADVFDAISNTEISPAMEQVTKQEQYTVQQVPQMDVDKIEEIAESIINDKWSDLVDHVNRIIEWKSSMEMKIAGMEEQIKTMKADFDMLHKSILERISDSDGVMREVSTDIKALEQVFKKILPGFVENVNELSRITQNIKGK